MSITRLNEFLAKTDEDDHLHDFLSAILPTITASVGCQSCQLLRGREDRHRFVIIEVWQSVEAHQDSIRNIPQDSFAQAMQMLAERPKGAYFTA